MNQYYILIPEKVENDIHKINEYFKTKSIDGYHIDNLKEVISIVSTQTRKSDGTAQLQMSYINKLVPMGQLYLKGLIDYGVVKRSGFYKAGEKSYSYSFAAEYKSKYKSYLLKNNKLIYRIEKAQAEFRKHAAKSVRGRSEQIKYLKLLTIDKRYYDFLESDKSLSIDQYNSILASATRISNCDIFYVVDDTSGRFHSNVTNMKKSIRSYLRINGNSLVNLDIKNSQPYLSLILLTDPKKVIFLVKDPDFADTLKNIKISKAKDVKKYISLVAEGKLYEFLMKEYEKSGLKLSRDDTKKQVMRILYARNKMPKNEINRQARQLFIKSFPNVHKIFSKVRGRNKGDKFHTFKRFAILLQSIEAHLILDVIVKRIIKELPETIVLTIHDSILTGADKSSIDNVRRIITDELTRFVGYEPVVSVEN